MPWASSQKGNDMVRLKPTCSSTETSQNIERIYELAHENRIDELYLFCFDLCISSSHCHTFKIHGSLVLEQ